MVEMYGLEAEESQGDIAVNLLPLVSKAERARLDTSTMSQDSRYGRFLIDRCTSRHHQFLRFSCGPIMFHENSRISVVYGKSYKVLEKMLQNFETWMSHHEREVKLIRLQVALNYLDQFL